MKVAEKSLALNRATASYGAMLEDPPFGPAKGKNFVVSRGAAEVSAKAKADADLLRRREQNGDRSAADQRQQVEALGDYAQQMEDWRQAEKADASDMRDALGRGAQFAITDDVVSKGLGALGATADDGNIVAP
jgi:hypothetical protein